jgi:hypothetical protein
MDVMFKKIMWLGLAASVLGVVAASTARADEWNKKSILTFSQPFEIPGHVLAAGTYTFTLADTMADRHIVRVLTADGLRVIATFMTVPDYRLTATNKTVIKFGEVPAGSPEVIRAWFYPGNTIGQEFVYPKRRAAELAATWKASVPAVAVDVDNDNDLRTARIIAVTPEQEETPVTVAIQTTPVADGSDAEVQPTGREIRREARREARRETSELPKTASVLPLTALFGFASVAVAFGLMFVGKRASASVQ